METHMFQMGNEVREGGLAFLGIRKCRQETNNNQHTIKLLDLILMTT